MLRRTHLEAIEAFRGKVHVLDFNEESARKASEIFKELQKVEESQRFVAYL